MTSNIDVRLFQHLIERDPSGFVARYNLDRLVFTNIILPQAKLFAREKQLKGWSREKKKRLIRQDNPMWRNLLNGLKAVMVEMKPNSPKEKRQTELIPRQARDDGEEPEKPA